MAANFQLIPPHLDHISIRIKLPASALHTFANAGKWVGKADCSIVTVSKPESVLVLEKNVEHHAPNVITEDQQKVIDFWNEHSQPIDGKPDQRDRNLKQSEAILLRANISKVIEKYGVDRVIEVIGKYNEAVACGGIVEYKFKHLGGIIAAMLNNAMWWLDDKKIYIPEDDPDFGTTKFVADTFADIVLGRKLYGKPDSKFHVFRQFGLHLNSMLGANSPLSFEQFVTMAILWAKSEHDKLGGVLFPKYLLSDNFVNIILPQKIELNLPGIKL